LSDIVTSSGARFGRAQLYGHALLCDGLNSRDKPSDAPFVCTERRILPGCAEENRVSKHTWMVVCLAVVSLSWPGKALPQTESPEALAVAKELMTVSKMTDQLKQILPAVTQQVRTLIVAAHPRAQ
jgi:hypothetical protein